MRESNSRLLACQASALTAELIVLKLAYRDSNPELSVNSRARFQLRHTPSKMEGTDSNRDYEIQSLVGYQLPHRPEILAGEQGVEPRF